MLGISWKDRKTNEFLQRGIKARAGQQENLLGIGKRRKLAWFGHISRHNSLAKTVLQGTLEGGRKRGRQVMLGRQPKRMDQTGLQWTGQPNPDEISREQTCLALAVTMCRSCLPYDSTVKGLNDGLDHTISLIWNRPDTRL